MKKNIYRSLPQFNNHQLDNMKKSANRSFSFCQTHFWVGVHRSQLKQLHQSWSIKSTWPIFRVKPFQVKPWPKDCLHETLLLKMLGPTKSHVEVMDTAPRKPEIFSITVRLYKVVIYYNRQKLCGICWLSIHVVTRPRTDPFICFFFFPNA